MKITVAKRNPDMKLTQQTCSKTIKKRKKEKKETTLR